MGSPYFAFVFDATTPEFKVNGFCSPRMAMFTADNDVTFQSKSGVSATSMQLAKPGKNEQPQTVSMYRSDDASVVVGKKKTPTFKFAVCDSDGNYGKYVLCGLFLRSTSSGGTNLTAFPGLTISLTDGATVLEQADHNGENASYNFYVLVQNAQGDISFIDPKITNQPE